MPLYMTFSQIRVLGNTTFHQFTELGYGRVGLNEIRSSPSNFGTVATAKLRRYTRSKNRRSLGGRRYLAVGRRSLEEFRKCRPML